MPAPLRRLTDAASPRPGGLLQRRNFIGLCGLAGLTSLIGCRHAPTASLPLEGRWVDLSTGQDIPPQQWLTRLRQFDIVLLGEQHDQTSHHRARGGLLATLKPGTVVAEHLTAGRRVGSGASLPARLEAAGFEARGWEWPLHEPLFRPLIETGVELRGGNAPREWVRSAAKDAPDFSWPAETPSAVSKALDAAPLSEAQRRSLEDELVQGHCGKLPRERLPGLIRAQSLRDATMAWTLVEALAERPTPVVLVAGNGHVRRDHGVAHWLQAMQPRAKVLSVGLLDATAMPPAGTFDVGWVLPATQRSAEDDPCAKV